MTASQTLDTRTWIHHARGPLSDPGALNMYRLVVCDLDGTLLNPEHRIGAYTREVLERLQSKRIAVMLASGRHGHDVRALATDLGINGGTISSNGAAVHDAAGVLIQHQALHPNNLDFLLRDPVFDGLHRNLYRVDDWLVESPNPELLRYHQESGFAYRVVDFATLGPEPVLKAFFYGDQDRLLGLEELVLRRFPGQLATAMSLPVALEVMPAGVSKGTALEHVMATLGLVPADVIAFGDAMNDLQLLKTAGKGVLMGNADPRLRAALTGHEIIGTNAEEAVAMYLEKLFL
jgi:Cof subfamily protein (haloacid dehalogenase superfamily)